MNEKQLRSYPLLEQLIGFDTVSRNSNLALIDFIEDYLKRFDIESERFYDSTGRKANLFATLAGGEEAGILLSGHTDVVPVDGEEWLSDPFTLTARDGRLYGRGTADMKGFLASILAAVPQFAAKPRRAPIHFAFSYDEEVGCLGVPSMIAGIEGRISPRVAIIGEPTELRPILGHKGKIAVEATVVGLSAHSAYTPDGVNAIEYAADLIGKIVALAAHYAAPTYQDDRFSPNHTTLQSGVIRGGEAVNIVPAKCQFHFEIRSTPQLDAEQIYREIEAYAHTALIPKMRAISPEAGIEFRILSHYPGLLTERESEAAQFVANLAESTEFGTVAFGTEGGLFHEAGIPTVVCGPGSMAQGHKPNEFITIEEMAKCDGMMDRLAAWMHDLHSPQSPR